MNDALEYLVARAKISWQALTSFFEHEDITNTSEDTPALKLNNCSFSTHLSCCLLQEHDHKYLNMLNHRARQVRACYRTCHIYAMILFVGCD